jgi:hypothetical protein
MLYAADFLEPGRSFEQEWRAGRRPRKPGEAAAVLPAGVAAGIRHRLEAGSKVRPESLGFWNALVQEGW